VMRQQQALQQALDAAQRAQLNTLHTQPPVTGPRIPNPGAPGVGNPSIPNPGAPGVGNPSMSGPRVGGPGRP
jgi:hypothetical protein